MGKKLIPLSSLVNLYFVLLVDAHILPSMHDFLMKHGHSKLATAAIFDTNMSQTHQDTCWTCHMAFLLFFSLDTLGTHHKHVSCFQTRPGIRLTCDYLFLKDGLFIIKLYAFDICDLMAYD
ncbi:hypothetical protein CsSME_00028981 [Camellia sinensis var. sinensis]